MKTTLEYRPSLDGLRAVAVLLVMFYHLDLPFLRGGYLGVDLFFVLSGYLITRLLLDEKKRTGTIDFTSFFARRAKRLLPGLYLLLIALGIAGGVFLSSSTASAIGRDSLASTLYVANWSFIFNEQSYFEAFADPSALRHMWSLAVEEQFYFLWPFFVLVLPLGRERRASIFVFCLLLCSAVAFALTFDPSDSSRAYYGTDTRIHEPLIGALLAVFLDSRKRDLAGLGRLALPCFGAILALAVVLGDHSPLYYMGGSLLFSLAVGGLLFSLEAPDDTLVRRVLSLPLLVQLGKISYGLYLWHWPVTLAAIELGVNGPILKSAAVLGLTLIPATLSYVLVEQRIRHATTLLRLPLVPRTTLVVALVVGSLLAVASFLRIHTNDEPSWASDQVVMNDVGRSQFAVIGDSVGKSLSPAYAEIAEDHGMSLLDAAMGGCSVAGGFQVDSAGKPFGRSQRCLEAVPSTLRSLALRQPLFVIWHSRSELYSLLDPQTEQQTDFGTPRHDALIQAGWQEAIEALGDIPVYVVGPITNGRRRKSQCGTLPNCGADDGSDGRISHLNDLLADFASQHAQVSLISIAFLVCPTGPPCLTLFEGEDWRVDGFHYSTASARAVAQNVFEAIPERLRRGGPLVTHQERPPPCVVPIVQQLIGSTDNVTAKMVGGSNILEVSSTDRRKGWTTVDIVRPQTCSESATLLSLSIDLTEVLAGPAPSYFYLKPTTTKHRFTSPNSPIELDLDQLEDAKTVRLTLPVEPNQRYRLGITLSLTTP